MPNITENTRLERVEHILSSGTGTLDFAVEGEQNYYTWNGREDSEWTVEGIKTAENDEEDRLVFYPVGDYFTCEIGSEREEGNPGPVRCWSE